MDEDFDNPFEEDYQDRLFEEHLEDLAIIASVGLQYFYRDPQDEDLAEHAPREGEDYLWADWEQLRELVA